MGTWNESGRCRPCPADLAGALPKRLRSLLAVVVLLVAGGAYGYPVVSMSPDRVRETMASNYQDGYADAAGYYTHYQLDVGGTWGADQELRDLADVAALLQRQDGSVRLVGYSLADSTPVYYTGDGSNLVPHRANFAMLRSYSIYFDGVDVNVDVELGLDFSASGLDVAGRLAFQSSVESSMEGWWNDRFHIAKDGGLFDFGIDFDVSFDGDNGHGETFFDHLVAVVADPLGTVRSNQGLFSAQADAATLAHEFGHMLGIYDEYWGGALDPGGGCGADTSKCLTDGTSLMGSAGLPFGAGMKPAYYEQFMAWLDDQDPDASQTYALVAEPPGAALLLLGLGLLGLWRRQARLPAMARKCR